ncbi:hypothetical protein LJC71_07460 [Desulfosarcina sp. OttesenSCG-928-A07]|nr:hypothetical protein [Desulfosarcina sp. OttesenSCG-928-G17]MDL2329562.1 hypothetical protein [Desulfosarcina sp. OttesenSCG-928-A07]
MQKHIIVTALIFTLLVNSFGCAKQSQRPPSNLTPCEEAALPIDPNSDAIVRDAMVFWTGVMVIVSFCGGKLLKLSPKYRNRITAIAGILGVTIGHLEGMNRAEAERLYARRLKELRDKRCVIYRETLQLEANNQALLDSITRLTRLRAELEQESARKRTRWRQLTALVKKEEKLLDLQIRRDIATIRHLEKEVSQYTKVEQEYQKGGLDIGYAEHQDPVKSRTLEALRERQRLMGKITS